MKVIFNKFIPFKGFSAINLFGVIFVREEYKSIQGTPGYNRMLNHEAIHTAQMREMLYVFFYIVYFLEWLFRLIAPPYDTAYKDISFEKEAKANEADFDYLAKRKHYNFVKYL